MKLKLSNQYSHHGRLSLDKWLFKYIAINSPTMRSASDSSFWTSEKRITLKSMTKQINIISVMLNFLWLHEIGNLREVCNTITLVMCSFLIHIFICYHIFLHKLLFLNQLVLLEILLFQHLFNTCPERWQ